MVAPARLQERQGTIQFLQLHRKRVQAVGWLVKSSASWSLRSELLLFQAVLSKFVRGIYLHGAQIDAGSLCGAAVVIDHNPAGTAVHGRCGGRGISISDLRHTTTGWTRHGTVLGEPEEEEIGSEGGIEKLRPSRAAGGGGSEKLL